MRYLRERAARAVTASSLLALLALAGCGDVSFNNVNLVPKVNDFFSDRLTFRGGAANLTTRPVSSEDLVGPDGQCAGAPAASAESAGGAGELPIHGGVALEMTECEVVGRAGVADKVDIAANPGGERTVTMTYQHGEWPGIYHFTAGRLVMIDRLPEAERPKPKGKAKPKSKAKQPA